ISYSSENPILNNKVEFPYVYRIISNELSEVDAIISIFKYFGWNWVGLIVSDDDYGYRASKRLEKVMRKESVCLDFLIRLKSNSYTQFNDKIQETIYKSTAKVIMLFLSSKFAENFQEFFYRDKIPKKIWIASSYLPRTVFMPLFPAFDTLNGTLVFSIQQGEIPGFKQFFYSLNPFKYQHDILLANMWQLLFECNLPTTRQLFLYNCTGNESFDNIDLVAYETFDFRISYRIYTAVYAMAHALHELYGTMTSHPKSAESLQVYFKQWQ
ncbi:hypothetical protein XELAEV_180302731mg, partial [Xenopus laevis]